MRACVVDWMSSTRTNMRTSLLAGDGARRTALVTDGDSGPALAVVRSLGRAGWRVLVPAGSRSARSRFAAAVVDLPDGAEHPDDFAAALGEALAAERVDVVAPFTDATLE